MDSLNRTDLDLRKTLYGNIILSGGSTLCRGELFFGRLLVGDVGAGRRAEAPQRWTPPLTPRIPHATGFGDRLLSEVKRIALKDVKLKIYAPPERKVGLPGSLGGATAEARGASTAARRAQLPQSQSVEPSDTDPSL